MDTAVARYDKHARTIETSRDRIAASIYASCPGHTAIDAFPNPFVIF